MNRFRHLSVARDDRDVVTAALDVAGRSVNVLDGSVIDELSQVVAEIAGDASVRMFVLRSGKEKGFAAGADLAQVRALATGEEVARFLEQGRGLGVLLESLTVPTLAVLHGACLGGGLELAMYCRLRVARDDSSTRLGLPETQLGLIPGWGGTWLLPRLVGPRRGLQMILNATTVDAREAERIGLVQCLAPAGRIEDVVEQLVGDGIAGADLPAASSRSLTGLQRLAFRWRATREIRLLGRSEQDNPAIPAGMRAVRAGALNGREAGLQTERDEFCRVLFDPRSRALLERFFEKRKNE
jgi:3-hydroxyacyl-CoA dehydrogenase/enoyl-CoA hydratase/3-hydroxybutyryl-CoA epimerase